MTTIFTQNGLRLLFWVKIVVIFWICTVLRAVLSFSAWEKSHDSIPNSQKIDHMQSTLVSLGLEFKEFWKRIFRGCNINYNQPLHVKSLDVLVMKKVDPPSSNKLFYEWPLGPRVIKSTLISNITTLGQFQFPKCAFSNFSGMFLSPNNFFQFEF